MTASARSLQQPVVASMVVIYDSGILGSDQASIDTGALGVAGGYSRITIEMQLRGTKSAQNCVPTLRINNDSGSNYRWRFNYPGTDGSGIDGNHLESASDTSIRIGLCPGASANAAACATTVIEVLNYAGSTFRKHLIFDGAASDPSSGIDYQFAGAGFYIATPAAITRVAVTPDANNWKAGSRMLIRGWL